MAIKSRIVSLDEVLETFATLEGVLEGLQLGGCESLEVCGAHRGLAAADLRGIKISRTSVAVFNLNYLISTLCCRQ